MLNIEYTKEMKNQDQLWESEKEDFEIMERLHNEIVNQAKENELLKDYYYITYFATDEIITEVYESEESIDNDEDPDYIACGRCASLIEVLKELSK